MTPAILLGTAVLAAAPATGLPAHGPPAAVGARGAAPTSRILPEVPVMAGLWESGSGFSFPMAAGARLAETRLVGRAPDVAVRAFYAQALPRAGWRQGPAPYAFRRGRERLVLHVAPHRAGGGVLTEALFVVTPDPAAAARRPKDPR